MTEKQRKAQIDTLRNQIGWIYRQLPWFSELEARQANEERNQLLRELSGWIRESFSATKLHSGPLSPGCSICGEGYWGCNFINSLCTRKCFYCPQDRSRKEDQPPRTDGIAFRNPTQHIHFIKKFQIQGVGFSGGEPLLAMELLLAHLRAIRRELGSRIYLWVYTNGDRVDRSTLQSLRRAGVNEIRFDLSARHYDLTPAILALHFIPTVTVEIPAIPEDFRQVKDLLPEMDQAGIHFVNLHQLMVDENNYQALRSRPYHFLHQPGVPVFESEMAALKLLLHARKRRLRLPINYCSSHYKTHFQGRGLRIRVAGLIREKPEEITAAGYIRCLRIQDGAAKLRRMIGRIQSAHCPTHLWNYDEEKNEMAIHHRLLSLADWSSARLKVQYFFGTMGLKNPKAGMAENNLILRRVLVDQREGWTPVAAESWQKRYIEKRREREVLKFYYENIPVAGRNDIERIHQEAQALMGLAAWEEIPRGMPEIF